jgi:(p)ppGpp synthase/HD superfamily hydrolase
MVYSEPCKYSIRLIEKLKSLDTQNVLDFELINKAVYWARKYHGDQKRKSGEPYYSHPLEVAYMVSEYKLNTDVIVASILHDIIEDTEVNAKMILNAFGQRIAEMVDRLTRDRPDGSKLSVGEILNNSYQEKDKEVLLIKLFDRFHNIQTIGSMTPEKQKKIAHETLQDIISLTTIFQDLNLEIELNTKSFTILYGKEIADQMIKKRYNIFSISDSYQPPLPTFQNEI